MSHHSCGFVLCVCGPQVVPPLRGAHGYKEAGAYVMQGCKRKPFQIGNRVHRFPFIEPDEPFATGDGPTPSPLPQR